MLRVDVCSSAHPWKSPPLSLRSAGKSPPLCCLLGFPVMAFLPLAIYGWGTGSSGRVPASPQGRSVFPGIARFPTTPGHISNPPRFSKGARRWLSGIPCPKHSRSLQPQQPGRLWMRLGRLGFPSVNTGRSNWLRRLAAPPWHLRNGPIPPAC